MNFPWYFLGVTLDVAGKLMIIWITLRLHMKHFRAHKVRPEDVRLDIALSILGLIFIAVGYALRAPVDILVRY